MHLTGIEASARAEDIRFPFENRRLSMQLTLWQRMDQI